jgi:hypothetical protein
MTTNLPSSDGDDEPRVTGNFILGAAIVVLAFFTVLANINLLQDTRTLSENDARQSECLQTSFADLTDALTVRAELNMEVNELRIREQELLIEGRELNSDQITAILDFAAKVLPNRGNEEVRQEAVDTLLAERKKFLAESKQLSNDLDAVRDQIRTTLDEQAKTKIPPFPQGSCNDGESE